MSTSDVGSPTDLRPVTFSIGRSNGRIARAGRSTGFPLHREPFERRECQVEPIPPRRTVADPQGRFVQAPQQLGLVDEFQVIDRGLFYEPFQRRQIARQAAEENFVEMALSRPFADDFGQHVAHRVGKDRFLTLGIGRDSPLKSQAEANQARIKKRLHDVHAGRRTDFPAEGVADAEFERLERHRQRQRTAAV